MRAPELSLRRWGGAVCVLKAGRQVWGTGQGRGRCGGDLLLSSVRVKARSWAKCADGEGRSGDAAAVSGEDCADRVRGIGTCVPDQAVLLGVLRRKHCTTEVISPMCLCYGRGTELGQH